MPATPATSRLESMQSPKIRRQANKSRDVDQVKKVCRSPRSAEGHDAKGVGGKEIHGHFVRRIYLGPEPQRMVKLQSAGLPHQVYGPSKRTQFGIGNAQYHFNKQVGAGHWELLGGPF